MFHKECIALPLLVVPVVPVCLAVPICLVCPVCLVVPVVLVVRVVRVVRAELVLLMPMDSCWQFLELPVNFFSLVVVAGSVLAVVES